MKKQYKAVLWILALSLAIGLGIWDGLHERKEPAPVHSEIQVSSPAGEEMMEDGSEIMKDTFLWHLRLKYPELMIWDAFWGEKEG